MANLSDLGLIGPPLILRRVEMEHTVQGRPFGFLHKEWTRLKGSMRPGDELRFYTSEDRDWEALAGEEGYVAVRNGEIVAQIITSRN